jgi:hypothetical protein
MASTNKTQIDFATGFNKVSPVPKAVRVAGLDCRLAVIQHTNRSDKVDMYFDEPLWRRLIEFAVQFRANMNIHVAEREGSPEVELNAFLAAWKSSESKPPGLIFVRDGQQLVLCIATEYWAYFGGPWPYHDSYTYSLYSKDDLTQSVKTFLMAAEGASGWGFGETIQHSEKDKPRRFSFNWRRN